MSSDVHLDSHTAPELCRTNKAIQSYIISDRRYGSPVSAAQDGASVLVSWPLL